jgi:hypothetical protein
MFVHAPTANRHPFFLLTPLWLLGLVEKGGNASRRFTIIASVFVAATVLVVPLRVGDLLHAMGPECRKCRIAIPYDGLAAALEARGFHSGSREPGRCRQSEPHVSPRRGSCG